MMRRVLHGWADGAAAFAAALAEHDPSWNSEAFPLAGGRVALWGRGMYVNRAFAVGLDAPMTIADFATLERRSAAVGVTPTIEVTPLTSPTVTVLAVERGYAVSIDATIALRHDLTDDTIPSDEPTDVVVEPAAGQLPVWQAVSAAGWGRHEPSARRASDAYAAVAAVVDGPGFVLARDAVDDRPLGCASVSIHDGVATLGGMSTLPTERRRGVQAALVGHRLRQARSAGCVIATTTTAAGGASERNLGRLGFAPWFEITTLVRSAAAGAR